MTMPQKQLKFTETEEDYNGSPYQEQRQAYNSSYADHFKKLRSNREKKERAN